MNVQELIDLLNKVEDKTKPVKLLVEYGMGCFEKTDSNIDVDDDDENEVVISGESNESNG